MKILIKLLHTADIHLDSPLKSLALRSEDLAAKVSVATRQAFEHLVDYAISEEISGLLIAGDLFDGQLRSAKTGAFLVNQLDRLNEQNISVFLIQGNHDAEYGNFGGLSYPSNVQVFKGRNNKYQLLDSNVWIHGVSFEHKHCPENLLGKFSEPVPNAINIGMLHTSLSGASGHDNYAPCSVEELIQHGFDYWALGHIHKRQVYAEDPWIVMPGIPQGRDTGEQGQKSATLITIDDDKISIAEKVTSIVEFLRLKIDVTGCESNEQVRSLVRENFDQLITKHDFANAIVRLKIIGQYEHRWEIIRDFDIWEETISNLALETGRIWVEELTFDLEDLAGESKSTTAVDELGEIMHQITDEEAFMAGIIDDCDEVLKQLSTELRTELLSEEDALVRLSKELAESGVQQVYARMKGRDLQ